MLSGDDVETRHHPVPQQQKVKHRFYNILSAWSWWRILEREWLWNSGAYQPFGDTEGRLTAVVHSFFSSVITPSGFVSHSLIDLQIYSVEKQDCFLEAESVLHTSRCRLSCSQTVVLLFFLHLPLVGSFLWSALRAVHHGRSSRPAEALQLLSGSISLCWHWGTHQSLMGENRMSTVIELTCTWTFHECKGLTLIEDVSHGPQKKQSIFHGIIYVHRGLSQQTRNTFFPPFIAEQDSYFGFSLFLNPAGCQEHLCHGDQGKDGWVQSRWNQMSWGFPHSASTGFMIHCYLVFLAVW